MRTNRQMKTEIRGQPSSTRQRQSNVEPAQARLRSNSRLVGLPDKSLWADPLVRFARLSGPTATTGADSVPSSTIRLAKTRDLFFRTGASCVSPGYRCYQFSVHRARQRNPRCIASLRRRNRNQFGFRINTTSDVSWPRATYNVCSSADNAKSRI